MDDVFIFSERSGTYWSEIAFSMAFPKQFQKRNIEMVFLGHILRIQIIIIHMSCCVTRNQKSLIFVTNELILWSSSMLTSHRLSHGWCSFDSWTRFNIGKVTYTYYLQHSAISRLSKKCKNSTQIASQWNKKNFKRVI